MISDALMQLHQSKPKVQVGAHGQVVAPLVGAPRYNHQRVGVLIFWKQILWRHFAKFGKTKTCVILRSLPQFILGLRGFIHSCFWLARWFVYYWFWLRFSLQVFIVSKCAVIRFWLQNISFGVYWCRKFQL